METVEVTDEDREAADAIAEAIASIGVAYSHDTLTNFQTTNRKWRVHEVGGNPFEKNEWLGEFDNKADAHALAEELRKERAHNAAARHRIAADIIQSLQADNDRLREALKFYASSCDAPENGPCPHDGNLCCRTAVMALATVD